MNLRLSRWLMLSALVPALVFASGGCDDDETVAPTPGADAARDTGGGGSDATADASSSDGAVGDAAVTDAAVDTGSDVSTDAPTVDANVGRRIYGIDSANQLVQFGASAPGTIVSQIAVTGLATSETIHGIDFRPSNGQLYAVGSTSTVYTVNTTTGVATAVGASFVPALDGVSFGVDFNPVADRLRVHSNTGQNHRLNPATGANAVTDGGTDVPLSYGVGNPFMVATAYSNSVSPTPAVTVIYAIDSAQDILTTSASPNNGVFVSVGSLGVDIGSVAGFDIWGGVSGVVDAGLDADASPGPSTTPEAYVAATAADGGTTATLYTINVLTGALTAVGPIGHNAPLRGIAVVP